MDLETQRAEPVAPPGGWPVPRSLYLHVPFCRHRCGYCNFSVIAGRDELADRFLDAVDRELALLERPVVDTIFIGGGTPTHLSPTQLERMLRIVADRCSLARDREWSIEANPEDIDQTKVRLLADAGVNRVSLGVQSFDPAKLKLLERGHDAGGVIGAVEQVSSEIDNVSLDLIFAAPGETLPNWQADLDAALSLPIRHLSSYALTFEKGTAFWSRRLRGRLSPIDERLEIEMFRLARQAAASAGMQHYEISNFARPGFRCRHNLAYWAGTGWYAAGPGAARFVDGRRQVNHRSPTRYLKRIEAAENPTAESESISVIQYARERAAFGIRLIEGIDLTMVGKETGVDLWKVCGDAVARSIDRGWLVRAGDRVKLTESGILFADSVAADFL